LKKLIKKNFIDFLIVTRKQFFSFAKQWNGVEGEEGERKNILQVVLCLPMLFFIAVLALSTSPSIFMKNAFFLRGSFVLSALHIKPMFVL
jgi:hypothetical protein